MSVISNFFNVGSYIAKGLVNSPLVLPDVEFTLNFYLYDAIRGLTATSASYELYSKTGRDELLVASTPTLTLLEADSNIWTMVDTIPTLNWDGKKTLLVKFTIVDPVGGTHTATTTLFKGKE